MGGGLEADLSHGVVAALWSSSEELAVAGWRPVLQVADVRRLVDDGCLDPEAELRYCVKLSDGVHVLPGRLGVSLNHLVRDGALRRGSVIRLLQFICNSFENKRRTIIIFQLEVLQTYCALIGSLKPYEPTRNPWGSDTRYAARGEPSFGGKCKPAVEVMSSSTSLSAEPAGLKVLAQIKDENLGYSDKPDIITVKAVISFIDTESFCYAICPLVVNGMPCNAKVDHVGDRTWHCKRCFQDIETCDYRYKVHIQIQDHTGTSSAIMHQKASNKIFGRTAKELYFLKDEPQDFPWFENIVHGVLCTQYLFKLKVEAKPLSYGSYWRHVCTVLEAEKVDPSAEGNRLLGVIDKLSKKGSRSNSEVCSGIPTYIGLSDFKARSSAQSPNSGPAISLGRASWLGSMDGFGPINGYAAKPASTLTSKDCGSGFGGHYPQTCFPGVDGQGPAAPGRFMDSFYGSLPVNNASGMCFKSKQTTEHTAIHRAGKS